MRAFAMALTVGSFVLGLGCAKSGGIKVADAGHDGAKRDGAGATSQDVGGSTNDVSGTTNNDSAPVNRDSSVGSDTLDTGKDAPVTDTRVADGGRDTGVDTRGVEAGTGNGRTVGALGQCTNGSCAGAAEFSACMTGSCDSDLRSCFGASYATGSFSGPCADYMTCLWSCPCDATAKACESKCLPLLAGGTCLTCLTNSACMLTSCGGPPACILPIAAPAPDGGSAPGVDGGSATGGCAKALACCSTLGTTLGPICTALVTGRTDAECDAVLSQPQYAAFCP